MTNTCVNYSTLPAATREWRIVPFDRAYRISDDGIVKSAVYGKLRRLRPWKTRDGYYQVSIRGKKIYMHRLLLICFVGDPPSGDSCADHINFVRDDNALGNLRWVSRADNNRHRRNHTLH